MKAVDPVPVYYRIYFRGMKSTFEHKCIVVAGEAERDRIMARKVPKAILCEVAQLHQCLICAAVGPWTEEWKWFGSYKQLDDGKPVQKFCSDKCHQVRLETIDAQKAQRRGYFAARFEPLSTDDGERDRFSRLRDAIEKNNHRKVPMPKVKPGSGICRWCAKPIFHDRGKKKGLPAETRSWHTPCYHRYLLFTDRNAQESFLLRRDGVRCMCCGKGGFHRSMETIWFDDGDGDGWIPRSAWQKADGWSEKSKIMRGDLGRCSLLKPDRKLEVDHITPLWKAFDYPEDMRWRLYGPENLWLICSEGPESCHKTKTRLEAAERAARRRQS